MFEESPLSNTEIAKRFKKYVKLRYMPLGVYFSEKKPTGKIRAQHMIFNRCIVGHAFKAAKYGGSSLIQKGMGCPGGQFWSGFRKTIISGWALFMTKGKENIMGGRAERYKKDVKVAVRMIRDPGQVFQPEGTKFIIYRPLKEIPDDQTIEFVLFFVNSKKLAKLISLCNYARHEPYMVSAPSGSGCMSILNYPLMMKKAPEPDAVMGVWDLNAIRSLPKNTLSLTFRHWFVEDMATDIPESFLAFTPPFTFWGELKLFFSKIKKRLRRRNRIVNKKNLNKNVLT